MRSAWEETYLSAPGDAAHSRRVAPGQGGADPIPLPMFLRYSTWFAENLVQDHDPSRNPSLESSGSRYRLTTAAGSEVEAEHIVVAVGVMPFAYVPPRGWRDCSETRSRSPTGIEEDAQALQGKRVLVVGGGQAGLESAGLAAQAGADVELVTRSAVRWFADREPHYPRTAIRQGYKLAYPVVGYGPPPLNRHRHAPRPLRRAARDVRRIANDARPALAAARPGCGR